MKQTGGDARLHFAEMFGALGHETRLAIVRLLLVAHPDGMVVGMIQEELKLAASTLSHHLETLHRSGVVTQSREGQHLRYRASADGLRDLLAFLYAECCTRNAVVPRSAVTR